MKTIIIMLILISSLLFSCNLNNKKKEQGFYDYSRSGDLYRIPLIEPYEITSADKGFTWIMEFKGNSPPSKLGTGNIDSIGLTRSYCILYNRRADLPNGMSKAWFVIDANKNEEKVFTSDDEYQIFLKSRNLNSLKLYDIKAVFIDFDKKGILPPEWPKK